MSFQIDAYIPRTPRVFEILLIDSDPGELAMVRRALSISVPVSSDVEHVMRFEDGLSKLATSRYDLIILDSKLTRTLTVPRTVPVIKMLCGQTPLAVTMDDVSSARQNCASELGVEHVVDKANMMHFLGSLFLQSSTGTVCNDCQHFQNSACQKFDRPPHRSLAN